MILRSALLPFLLLAACGSELDAVPLVTVQQLHDAMNQQHALAIDVRTRDAFKLCHIKGAAHIPLSEIAARASELPTGRKLVTYCS